MPCSRYRPVLAPSQPSSPLYTARAVLPIPPHFDPQAVGEVWRVSYDDRAREAELWAAENGLRPAAEDTMRICLVAVDVQNTFCIPAFELFVAGRSGRGAIDDNRRLCEFVYRNLDAITQIVPTLDTHQAMQVFHPLWLVDEEGNHPEPYTLVSATDVAAGRWQVDPAVAETLGLDPDYAHRHLIHYTRALEKSGKYRLTIWPYHAMLGGIGHALVPAVGRTGEGNAAPDRALLRARPRGDRRAGRRPARRAERGADREAARVRRRRDRRPGQEPLRRVDDRRPPALARARRARARAEGLSARGLHVPRGRARGRRLHRRGGRGLCALRGGGHAHRALDRSDRELARNRRHGPQLENALRTSPRRYSTSSSRVFSR